MIRNTLLMGIVFCVASAAYGAEARSGGDLKLKSGRASMAEILVGAMGAQSLDQIDPDIIGQSAAFYQTNPDAIADNAPTVLASIQEYLERMGMEDKREVSVSEQDLPLHLRKMEIIGSLPPGLSTQSQRDYAEGLKRRWDSRQRELLADAGALADSLAGGGKPAQEAQVPAHLQYAPEHFLDHANRLVKASGLKPVDGMSDTYVLTPANGPAYQNFLEIFHHELGKLPFDHRVGETILMRKDAREAARRLKQFVGNQLEALEAGLGWSRNTTAIADIFRGGMEVFKNEIYRRHKQEGVGYSVDLSAFQDHEPARIRLERRYVRQKPSDIQVRDHGFFDLHLRNGTLEMDLTDWETSNVHRGNQ